MNEKIIQVYVCMVDVSRYVWYGMVVIKVFIFRYSFPRCNTCGRNWYLFTDPIFTHLGYFTHFGNLTTLYIWPPWIFYPPWIFHTFWIFYRPWIFDHLAPRLPLCLAITNILQEIDFLKQFNNAICQMQCPKNVDNLFIFARIASLISQNTYFFFDENVIFVY